MTKFKVGDYLVIESNYVYVEKIYLDYDFCQETLYVLKFMDNYPVKSWKYPKNYVEAIARLATKAEILLYYK